MMDLGPGSVIQTSAFKHQYFGEDGKQDAAFSYVAPKGKAFVLVLLGATPKGEDFDVEGTLIALGWTPPVQPDAVSQSEQRECCDGQYVDEQPLPMDEVVRALGAIESWRRDCHAYDADTGQPPRAFGGEDFDWMEAKARSALTRLKGEAS